MVWQTTSDEVIQGSIHVLKERRIKDGERNLNAPNVTVD